MYHLEMCLMYHVEMCPVSHISSRDVSHVSSRMLGNEMRSPEERRTAILRLIRWAQHDAVKQDLWCSVRDPFHRGYSGETFLLLFIFFNQTMNLLPRRVLVLLFPGLSCLQDCPVSRTVLSPGLYCLMPSLLSGGEAWRRGLQSPGLTLPGPAVCSLSVFDG